MPRRVAARPRWESPPTPKCLLTQRFSVMYCHGHRSGRIGNQHHSKESQSHSKESQSTIDLIAAYVLAMHSPALAPADTVTTVQEDSRCGRVSMTATRSAVPATAMACRLDATTRAVSSSTPGLSTPGLSADARDRQQRPRSHRDLQRASNNVPRSRVNSPRG